MSIGKPVLKEYRFDGGDNAVITILGDEEIMVEIDACTITTIDELHELAQWLEEKAVDISTKFATGEFTKR